VRYLRFDERMQLSNDRSVRHRRGLIEIARAGTSIAKASDDCRGRVE
jgi:hypothetical protein